MPAYQVTGNEYVSLPAIREDTGAVQGLTVLHMGAKGLLETVRRRRAAHCARGAGGGAGGHAREAPLAAGKCLGACGAGRGAGRGRDADVSVPLG